MKKTAIISLMLLLIMTVCSVSAEDVVLVDQNTYYMCGDSFEICFPSVISFGNWITSAGRIQATANHGEQLIQVRIQMRNMTTSVLNGMSKESFKLTGYVRDRSVTYLPEIIMNTDYFGAGNYFSWDQLPPLRLGDILLIFRVNPILINWELTFEPVFMGEGNYQLDNVTYPTRETDSCKAIFQFPAILDTATGELTKYIR